MSLYRIEQFCDSDGKYNRFGFHAVKWSEGTKEWLFHDKWHRLNGPAETSYKLGHFSALYDIPITINIDKLVI